MNTRRQVLTYALLLLVFGVAVPQWKGLGFLDPALLCAYACLAMVFAGPVAAQSFEKQPASTAQALGWIARALAFGEGLSVAMLACALVTLYVTHSKVLAFPPDLGGLAMPEALGLALSLAVASMAAWTATQFSVNSARAALRAVFLVLLVAFFLRGPWLPQVVGQATLVALAAAAVFLGLLTRCVGQHRLRQA
jgi:hypothetical protein